ncbi:uncharacterized protein BDZ99DRAFT_7677 [Mytilinidion resinicola]|uniref:F-box domain-containing protein n=1 Tax=Mytilinidion resinicola TaxID=574789 RepID=A0A6A6Z8H3_9PEZI|nr:uncharacterized protein BDZ99DRAFT_7677 [Mytilinidion resinicola]KAF2817033.1 hypothetical protein BDZ99DRAFT_7677 [Mytilinidion resinicola]
MVRTRRRQKNTFPFFELPPELRNMVYGLLLGNSRFSSYTTRLGTNELTRITSTGNLGIFLPRLRFHRSPPLIRVSRQMRLEYGSLFFNITEFDLTSSYRASTNLEMVCKFLEGIGEIVRANIKKIKIDWWMDAWMTTHSIKLKHELQIYDGFIQHFINVLLTYQKLETLEIHVPNKRALSVSKFKKHLFDWACGFAHLRNLKDKMEGLTLDVFTKHKALLQWLDLEDPERRKVE